MTRYKVGGVYYDVVEVDGLSEKEGLFGRVLYGSNLIEIDSRIAPGRKRQVIVHELQHALFYEAGFDDQDEDEVNRLAIVLHQFLVDNFGFVTNTGTEKVEVADIDY